MLGPPPTSGTRDAFLELVMETGCSNFAWIKSLKDVDEARFKRVCHSIREDGAYVEAGENDNLIVQKLRGQSEGAGHLRLQLPGREPQHSIQGSLIDGVAPTFETSRRASTRCRARCSST